MSSTPTSHLASRFLLQRPTSASGYRPQLPPSGPSYEEYYDGDPYHQQGAALARRPSKSRREAEDRRQMPPPALPPMRSMTTGPMKGGPFLPPPPGPPKLHYKYDDDDLAAADPSMYREVPSRNASWAYGEVTAPPRRSRRESVTYDNEGYQIEPAGNRRRHSYIGTSAGSTDYHDKLRDAEKYQGQLSGGTVPLTKETLGKVDRQKRSSDKSSRSTRSSASRDESDYWNSNTTRTTRSFAGEGDTSIRIKGGATLRLGDMEIQCQDGGEISITQDGSTRGGSERGSTIWPEERPDRRRQIDNVPHRPRPTSQAASYTRSQFVGSYEGYPGRI